MCADLANQRNSPRLASEIKGGSARKRTVLANGVMKGPYFRVTALLSGVAQQEEGDRRLAP
jgi:hypothetical protein